MFCEDAATAETASKLFAGRRFAALDATVRKGGIQAAIAAYAGAPTPDLVIVESTQAGAGVLAELETLANVCDAGTRVIVIGHINDVLLYRELVRRGISDYLVAPLSPGQLGESIRDALTGQAGETRGPGRRLSRGEGRLRVEHGLPQHRLAHRRGHEGADGDRRFRSWLSAHSASTSIRTRDTASATRSPPASGSMRR